MHRGAGLTSATSVRPNDVTECESSIFSLGVKSAPVKSIDALVKS